jgi:hypothetical protein
VELTVSILSLIVALLAVVVAPWVSWLTTRRTLESAERATIRQVLAPMRQAWINELRSRLAEFSAATLNYFVSGHEDRNEKEYFRLTQLEEHIVLMLNPAEDAHRQLEATLRLIRGFLGHGKEAEPNFIEAHKRLTELSRTILKTEWDRVKQGI